MERVAKGTSVRRGDDGYWEWFEAFEELPYDITGKYLFFSRDRELLVSIAVAELTAGRFHEAKIPLPGLNFSEEYVMCLYYRDDSRKHQLGAKYRGHPNVKYRYWKSDEDTAAGKYSKEFRNQIPKEIRPAFSEEENKKK